MKWIKYECRTTTAAAELAGEILYAHGITGFEVTDHVPLTPEEEKQMYTDIPADRGVDDGSAVLTFYTQPQDEEMDFYSTGSSLRDERLEESVEILPPDELIQAIRSDFAAWGFPEPDITCSIQDDADWKDKWKENFTAFRVAPDIIIKPVWEDRPDFATPQDHILEIEPGSSFGTGTHETTKLCLLALRKHIRPDTTILDAGCGSGILAISALISGALSAFCLDIDPSAVTGTLENASLNHLDNSRLTAIQANILEDSSQVHAMHPEPFQIVVANILADVIIPLAGVIPEFLQPGGLFISSGILAEKADLVEQALVEHHFRIQSKDTLGDWVSFTARLED